MGLVRSRAVFGALSLLVGFSFAAPAVSAAPSLVVDVASGAVLHQEDATRPWYPASLTKLMTVYVALQAVREGRMTLQTPMVVSRRAARMAPSKMGFKPGTEVTLENALKMIMVKSANDVSVTIAEGVSGSVEAFAEEMNAAARALGMTQSHFVNPNGLHDPAHVSSARDMALLGRALFLQFPEQQSLYGIGALKLGTRVIPTHNGILGRYPGADGMKTGFVCASGFNVVASANRGGRRLIAVVLGSHNAKSRTLKAMAMFEAGFSGSTFGARPSLLALTPSSYAEPPNLREDVCGRNRNRNTDEDFAIPVANAQQPGAAGQDTAAAFFASDRLRNGSPALAAFANGDLGPRPAFTPEPVYVGRAPGWTGVARAAAVDEAPEPEEIEAPAKPVRARAAKAPRKPKVAATPAIVEEAGDTKPAKAKAAPKAAAKAAVKPAPKAAAKTEKKDGAKPMTLTGAKPAPKAAPKAAATPAPAAKAKPKADKQAAAAR
ncbi:MAG TPA: D-alanyl-D-alanine carboxypeptidase family protein [Beijerinckiaceae bacterium]|jgi:D-alanyl-D-alanine carboxypeptidase